MVDKELLKACVLNPWSVVPRMMLIDSMIESGYSEAKAMEAFEPPTLSNYLPLTYNVSNTSGFGGGLGGSSGVGNGRGLGSGVGRGLGDGLGRGSGIGVGVGRGFSNGLGSYDDNCGFLMIAKQQ